jgi:dynein heavy chain, axonemal
VFFPCITSPSDKVLGHYIQDAVDLFSKTLPVLKDLRNPAMRPRHWASLSEAVGTPLDPASDMFTTGQTIELHLHQHADTAAALSIMATKELAIEQTISVCTRAIIIMIMITRFESKATHPLGSGEVKEGHLVVSICSL